MTEAKSMQYVRQGQMAASARVILEHPVITNISLQTRLHWSVMTVA